MGTEIKVAYTIRSSEIMTCSERIRHYRLGGRPDHLLPSRASGRPTRLPAGCPNSQPDHLHSPYLFHVVFLTHTALIRQWRLLIAGDGHSDRPSWIYSTRILAQFANRNEAIFCNCCFWFFSQPISNVFDRQLATSIIFFSFLVHHQGWGELSVKPG